MQLIIVSQNNMKQKLAALREKISEIIVNFDSPFSAIDTRTSPKRKKIMKE